MKFATRIPSWVKYIFQRLLFDAMSSEGANSELCIKFPEVLTFKAAMSGSSKDKLAWVFRPVYISKTELLRVSKN